MPTMAGTMDRRRENSNNRGVRRCWRVFGGTRGPDEGIMREVGRCFGWRGVVGQYVIKRFVSIWERVVLMRGCRVNIV